MRMVCKAMQVPVALKPSSCMLQEDMLSVCESSRRAWALLSCNEMRNGEAVSNSMTIR